MIPFINHYMPYGLPATGAVTFLDLEPTAASTTITINGTAYTYGTHFRADSPARRARALAALINADATEANEHTNTLPISFVFAYAIRNVCRVIATQPGISGNSLTLATTMTALMGSVTAATLSGGTSGVQLGSGSATSATVTRPANATPYDALDVVGATAAAFSFSNVGPSGAEIQITSVTLRINTNAVPTGMAAFNLHLYNVTPPSAIVDNAAFDLPSGDRASYLGYIVLPVPVDLGATLWSQVDLTRQLTLASTSLFAYLQTVGGFTPDANSEVYVPTLHTRVL